jgi:cytochrome c peroxidase
MMKRPSFLFALSLIGLLAACSKDSDNNSNNSPSLDNTAYALDFGAFPSPNIAVDNPLTVEKVKLGRMLFFEKKMSLDNSMSCASCHRQEHAFSDTAQFSIGVHGLPGKRQAMAVFNMAWNSNGFFWDGRAPLLRDQSLKPIEDSLEMAENLDNVIDKLSQMQLYRDQFVRAFGSSEINEERMSFALEAFMNSIVSVNSTYDAFLRGDVQLTAQQERGRFLFFQEYNPFFPAQSGADCAHCHSNINFENDLYMNNGLDSDGSMTDLGFFEVTGNVGDKGKMKVPSLRNIALTAPYMHDGRFSTLEEVVQHYNIGVQQSASLDPALAMTLPGGLLLSDTDVDALVAFLHTLTDLDLPNDAAYSDPFAQ